ncbi:hypothetical protein SLS60_008414 [Paraconiothyrium brasiliense]|uniref:FAD-binding PCMH-type domain-containing protein n=1 Tax=Paraconiothyrium brasiliense TaxID=300254 RepID=A0ABR3R0H8_9PLEO
MAPLLPALLLATSLLSIPSQARILFPFEQRQLTKEYIASLSEEDQALFGFDDELSTLAVNTTDKRCRFGPADGKWPAEKAWTRLAKQLSTTSALIKTTPQASVCYGAAKDDAKCQDLTKSWTSSYTHIDDPTEVLSPIYQGLTCQPPTIYNSGSCTLGGYPSYVIKAADVLDIQLGINFARNDYLRLIVKNTGHDFGGKSVGAGALSIWTHGLKDIEFFDNYADGSYKGAAVKAGAGVQAFDLYKAANDKGLVVVGGEGQTVGIMGGYIQGGGHSPLSSLYGMAADNVLGFEVVTPTGEFLTANSTSNPDLFFALRGGGGGTFGIVTSVTVKAFKDLPVTAASWSFDSTKLGKDKFWAAAKAVLDRSVDYVDNGIYTYLIMAPTVNGKDFTFTMQPFFAPNKTTSALNTILAPLQSQLTALNIPFSPKITEYKGFYPAWQAEFPLETQSDVQTAFGSRLFPRSNFASETGRNVTFAALRQTVEAGQPIIAFNLAPTLARGGNPDNAVNPAWRTAVLHAITGQRWDVKASASDIRAARTSFTNGTMKRWRDVTPGSGSYLNEADRLEPNWQQSFWGDKYAKLAQIKKEWDPKDVFWAANAVGSEGWVVESVDGLPNENGKLCKVNGTKSAVVAEEQNFRAF